MQNLSSTVLVALGGALVVFGGYHVLVIAPRMQRLTRALEAHDALLGGDGGNATNRVISLEKAAADLAHHGAEVERRVTLLETSVAQKLPHIGFVRYNAFESSANTGLDLSYALALLTKTGDGVVISSIYSREETRTYGKAVTGFNSAQDASSEERAAIAKARASAS